MIHLTMYGQQTSAYEYIKMVLLESTKKAQIDLKITEVNDWAEIVRQKIPSLPTIRVNNHIDMSYSHDQHINEYVHDLTTQILKEENYGTMLKIIVPTDFSETATNALVFAHNLSKTVNGMIKLVHVYRPEVAHIDNLVVVDKELESAKRQQLDDFVEKVNSSWIGASKEYIPMESEFKVGFAAEEINALCESPFDQHLVVAGSTGSGNNLKNLFGSISLQLIKSCPSPVLVVPPKTTYNGIRRILFTVSNVEKDLLACKTILKFAKEHNAEIHLLHVKTDGEEYPQQVVLDQCRLHTPDTEVKFAEVTGDDVISSIDQYISDHQIDLVSMTTFERGFWQELFHKSLTKKMAIHTNIPLLVVPI